MESNSKVEVLKEAIRQVMEEDEATSDADHRLLNKLLSQLELEGKSKLEEEQEENILKELKKVRRQNVITHCLLSLMIILTVAWQISEVSIILKLKDGVKHPFRSIGSMFMGIIKPRQPQDVDDADTSITSNLIESTPVNDLKLPMLHLPQIDLPFNHQD